MPDLDEVPHENLAYALAAGLTGLIGRDRGRWKSPDEWRAYAGTCPVTSQSGSFAGVHFRTACHRTVRWVLGRIAFGSLRNSAWAKEYDRRKRREGKTHAHVLRCLAARWTQVLFAIWQNRTPYSEERHLASMARHALFQELGLT